MRRLSHVCLAESQCMINTTTNLQRFSTDCHFEWKVLIFFMTKTETTVSIPTPHVNIMRIRYDAHMTVSTRKFQKCHSIELSQMKCLYYFYQ